MPGNFKNILLLTGSLLACSIVFGQFQLSRILKSQFRVNPIGGPFPAFLETLRTDPDLLNKKETLKTDSTMYILTGEYKVFNPFNFPATKVEILFAEDEFSMKDRKNQPQYLTFYNYQIIVYCQDNPAIRKALEKEYNTLARKLKRDLPDVEASSLRGVKNVQDGEVRTYYNKLALVSPASLSWQTLSQSKQLVLTLLIRLRVVDNYAVPFGFSKQSIYGNSD